jgi:hypothetical protein
MKKRKNRLAHRGARTHNLSPGHITYLTGRAHQRLAAGPPPAGMEYDMECLLRCPSIMPRQAPRMAPRSVEFAVDPTVEALNGSWTTAVHCAHFWPCSGSHRHYYFSQIVERLIELLINCSVTDAARCESDRDQGAG